MISTGDKLPQAHLLAMGANGPEQIDLQARLAGRKVALFAVPGAYTPTCHSAHVPSFIRSADALADKGVDEIICVSVNDPFVMQQWGAATGADQAGIAMLSDHDGAFSAAIGMNFDAPPAGLYGRSKRYAMLVEDGTVTIFHPETGTGCDISGGEALLDAMG